MKKIFSTFGYAFISIICLVQFYLLTENNGFYMSFMADAHSHGMYIGLGELAGVGLIYSMLGYLLFFVGFNKWYWLSNEANKPINAFVFAFFMSAIIPFISCCLMLLILGDFELKTFMLVSYISLIAMSCLPFYLSDTWKKKVCSNCGEEIGTENYCSICGNKIDKE